LSDSTAQAALLVAVCLLIVSEAALFVSILWVVIMFLVTVPTGSQCNTITYLALLLVSTTSQSDTRYTMLYFVYAIG
jgi:hypothetical protein